MHLPVFDAFFFFSFPKERDSALNTLSFTFLRPSKRWHITSQIQPDFEKKHGVVGLQASIKDDERTKYHRTPL